MIQGRLLLILIACLALCTVSVSAFTVQPPSGIPSGDLAPGTRVNIDTTVSFPTTSGTTFPSSDTLQFYTELESVRWNIVIVLNAIENPRPLDTGRIVRISGFELEYPGSMDLKVRVNLEGTTPEVTTTDDKTILRIRQLGPNDVVRGGGEYSITRKVVNPAEVQSSINSAKADLQTLKTSIDAAQSDGVNTAAIEVKYNAARTALESASAAGTNVGTAQTHLSTARTNIDEAKILLEQAVVQHSISTAEGYLAEIDSIIDYLSNEQGRAGDSRVILLTSKRQSIKNLIDTAKDSFEVGNYARAETQAQDAVEDGQRVLQEARDLKEDIESLPTVVDPDKPFLWIIIAGIIIVVIGFVVVKKRRAWDELG
ncbi:hypothetical protein RJ53_06525 [Methanocalculus chunghsingensis]|uniref:Uncharacterized protein n=1 Tax=Methanocalculus chunghsingensis TaxID=156457 RepID=A0A8J7W6D6_9EURY|nr:hypothetical protein [Methanocalculus chunghsingensis]MBR1369164.1 hypothetical protein [Methanocalculus chunghsingensis]